jgi:hypothetical protein
MSAVGIQVLQKPAVPVWPEMLKLIAVPLKVKLDIVELLMAWTVCSGDALKLLYVPIRGYWSMLFGSTV